MVTWPISPHHLSVRFSPSFPALLPVIRCSFHQLLAKSPHLLPNGLLNGLHLWTRFIHTFPPISRASCLTNAGSFSKVRLNLNGPATNRSRALFVVYPCDSCFLETTLTAFPGRDTGTESLRPRGKRPPFPLRPNRRWSGPL